MRNRILDRLTKKKKEKKSIMFLDQGSDDQSVNLNLNRFNRNVRNPDLANALTVGGGTFLLSSGISSGITAHKQAKGKNKVYEDYIEGRGGKGGEWWQNCVGPECPAATAFTPDKDWFYTAAGNAEDMWNNQGYWTGSSSEGTSGDFSAFQAVEAGRREGTILSPKDLQKQYWDNIKTGFKRGVKTGVATYLLNKAFDKTRFGRKLQNKLNMDITIGPYREQGGFYSNGGLGTLSEGKEEALENQIAQGVIEEKEREQTAVDHREKARLLNRADSFIAKRGGYYNTGGTSVEGGMVTDIPNSDAIEFTGATHEEGGIHPFPDAEVEDGETMDGVTTSDGETKDYFFSDHLKRGGLSYAQHHKNILSEGGSQEDIDYLAKLQEKAANRDPNKIGYAKLGGVMKYGGTRYSNGGTFKARSDKANKIIEIMRAQGYNVPDVADLGDENISQNQAYLGSGYYGEKNIKSDENRKDFYNRNKDILSKIDMDNDGNPDITSWEDFDPKKHTGAFQSGFNDDMMTAFNNDPDLMKAFGDAELTDDDLKQFGFYTSANTDDDTDLDDNFGEYTWSRTPFWKDKDEKKPCPEYQHCPEGQTWKGEPDCRCEGEIIKDDPCPQCPDGTTPVRDENGNCPCTEEKKIEEKKKRDWQGNLLGLGAMIPAVMAFTDKPDYMESPDLVAPGIVKPERVAKQHLDRVDFNDQIARNANDAQAMQKYIETSGGGPANMSNKMMMYAKKQEGDRAIKAQEAKANIAIANEEAVLDNKRKAYNAEAALDASKFNVDSQTKAAMENTRNRMLVDEFNRGSDAATKDRKLNAVQYGLNTLATLYRDKKTREASDNFANAIDGQRGTLERFFNEDGTMKNFSGSESSSSSSTTTTTTDAGTGKVIPNEEEKSSKRGGWRKMKLKRRRKYGK